MLGYLKDPEGTSKCMREDGWFYTGDVGVMHPDGYLEVKDRSKDVIICGGENLSSVEVESVLYSHPAVNEAAVVARPDRYWGEIPCAFVSVKEEVVESRRKKRDKGVLQGEAAAVYGAKNGSVQGGASKDLYRQNPKVFAKRYG
ncbi:UNVERIFIED_CONTAM: putative acyl-activating enzyme 4 [Sesamum angustifolium]|uniref:Acyl-activating enzyme 4 n=1 Tax=Sesamum angustifolium TaxID=2727405 RepID=A0AAW2KG85_9LAMI